MRTPIGIARFASWIGLTLLPRWLAERQRVAEQGDGVGELVPAARIPRQLVPPEGLVNAIDRVLGLDSRVRGAGRCDALPPSDRDTSRPTGESDHHRGRHIGWGEGARPHPVAGPHLPSPAPVRERLALLIAESPRSDPIRRGSLHEAAPARSPSTRSCSRTDWNSGIRSSMIARCADRTTLEAPGDGPRSPRCVFQNLRAPIVVAWNETRIGDVVGVRRPINQVPVFPDQNDGAGD